MTTHQTSKYNHSAPPALYLAATPAGMQYSLGPPPATTTRKGETQGRLF